jgi:hypothetical protein
MVTLVSNLSASRLQTLFSGNSMRVNDDQYLKSMVETIDCLTKNILLKTSLIAFKLIPNILYCDLVIIYF